MKYYDPNINYGIHTVEVTLQQWGYVGHIIQRIDGSCKGKDILDFDFECEDGNLENDCNLKYDEDYEYFSATLMDINGNTLEVEGDAEEFNKLIVKVEIIDFVKDKNK